MSIEILVLGSAICVQRRSTRRCSCCSGRPTRLAGLLFVVAAGFAVSVAIVLLLLLVLHGAVST